MPTSTAPGPNLRRAAPPDLLERVRANLARRGFVAHVAHTHSDALRLILGTILPLTEARGFSYGGSLTLAALAPELFPALAARGLELLDTHEPGLSWPESFERRRAALLTDLFFTGTNALTEGGQLVNLDAVGNRIAALTFGPRHVVVLVGRNKIVPDLAAAMDRVRRVAPLNAARLGFNTPCVKAGHCVDCASESRICKAWSIIERPFTPDRIHVVIINEDLGL